MVDQEVGKLVYQVEMEVGKLIESQHQLGQRLDNIEGGFNKTTKSVVGTEKAFSSLTKVAASLTAALSVKEIASYANAWVDVNNKLVNSVRPTEQLAEVTQRIFDISQSTRASLEATATLYGRLERATRSLGTSTADLTTLTTTINRALVVSGATTQEAASATIQLSQALASGVLRGQEFNSIAENGSRISKALADSLGVTIGQLRQMAAQGKLTTDVVVDGLLKQSDAIATEFGKTALTMGQSFTVATNNITKFVGESTSVNTSINVFNSSIITLSENLDTVTTLIGAAALVMGSRYVGALTLATSAKVKDAAASINQAVQTRKSAQASMASATAQIAEAEATIASAQAKARWLATQSAVNAANGLNVSYQQEYLAIQRQVTAAEASAAAAKVELAASTRAASAANQAYTVSLAGLKGALALVGGPAGAAILAASAIFYFYQKAQQARAESIAFADTLDGVISKMKEMNQVQLGAQIAKAQQSMVDQNKSLSDMQDEYDELEKKKAFIIQAKNIRGATVTAQRLAEVNNELAQKAGDLDSAQNKLSQTINKTGILQAQMNGTFEQGIDLLKRDGHEATVTAGLINQLGDALNIAAKAKDKFNSSSLAIPRSAGADKLLDGLNKENQLLQITDKRQRAVTESRMKAEEAGGNVNQVREAGEMEAQHYDLQKADAARNKTAKNSQKTEDEGAKKVEDLQRQLGYLALQYDDSSREAAVYNAMQAAGAKATDVQKQKIGELAGELFDAKQRQSDLNAAIAADPARSADKTYSDATKQLKRQYDEGIVDQQQFNQQSLKLAQDHATAIAQANANAAVTPQQEAAGTVDPVQQLANENAKKLALIQQFETNKTITEQQGIALRKAANKQYEQERTDAMFALWSQQNVGNQVLAASLESFSQSASGALSGVITGTQSASDAMRGLANTVLNSVIQTFVEMGLQQVKSAIMGATAQQAAIAATTTAQGAGISVQMAASTTAAAETTAAWTPAAIMSSVASFGGAVAIGLGAMAGIMALSGKRKNGGPVSSGSMYQVGEGGMPEIYQSSSGRQYMIPGDNGSVISNKDMQGGGSGGAGGVIVNINNYTPATVDMQQTTSPSGGITIDVFVADMNAGGPMSQSITSNTSATRRANNQ